MSIQLSFLLWDLFISICQQSALQKHFYRQTIDYIDHFLWNNILLKNVLEAGVMHIIIIPYIARYISVT